MKGVYSFYEFGTMNIRFEAWESDIENHDTILHSIFPQPMAKIDSRRFQAKGLKKVSFQYDVAMMDFRLANIKEAVDLIYKAYPDLLSYDCRISSGGDVICGCAHLGKFPDGRFVRVD